MANRTFEQFQLSLERKVVKLFAKITYTNPGSGVVASLVTSEILNAGTSPITINPSQGFQSLTDNGSGLFTLYFGANNGGVPTYDSYVRLLSVSGTQVQTAGAQNALISLRVAAEDVAGSSGNPSIQLETFTTGGGPGPGPLDDGNILYLEITLSNTSAY